jgi:hypothetical protein
MSIEYAKQPAPGKLRAAATLKAMKGGKGGGGKAMSPNQGQAALVGMPMIKAARTEETGVSQTHLHDGNIHREPPPAGSPGMYKSGNYGQGGADGAAGTQGGSVNAQSGAAERRPLMISNAQKKGLKATLKRVVSRKSAV